MENRQPIRPEHLVESFGVPTHVSPSANHTHAVQGHMRRLRVHAPTPELRDWLDQHTPGWRYLRRTVIFVSPDHAFEFRMRWA